MEKKERFCFSAFGHRNHPCRDWRFRTSVNSRTGPSGFRWMLRFWDNTAKRKTSFRRGRTKSSKPIFSSNHCPRRIWPACPTTKFFPSASPNPASRADTTFQCPPLIANDCISIRLRYILLPEFRSVSVPKDRPAGGRISGVRFRSGEDKTFSRFQWCSTETGGGFRIGIPNPESNSGRKRSDNDPSPGSFYRVDALLPRNGPLSRSA